MRARALATVLLALAGCFAHADAPPSKRAGPAGALGGHAPRGFDPAVACGRWGDAVGAEDPAAATHVGFAELSPTACHVRVRYDERGAPSADPIPPGCGYPEDEPAAATELARWAEVYARVAAGRPSTEPLPMPIACALPDDVRRAAAGVNARTLRSVARRLATGRRFPYAAASTLGFGHAVQGGSALVPWRPDDPCPALSKSEMDLFSVNIVRAGRAAAAQLAGIAPVMTASGGAVHSPLYEAFMMHYLATCRFGVRRDAVLLDPCADHTHTNLKNTGALVVELGGRTAYVVTDDGIQAAYLQEWTFFDVLGGSIDQRALRDFGYLLGSWRQASVGIDAGFWFTPYRFWASPRGELGSFTCVQ